MHGKASFDSYSFYLSNNTFPLLPIIIGSIIRKVIIIDRNCDHFDFLRLQYMN